MIFILKVYDTLTCFLMYLYELSFDFRGHKGFQQSLHIKSPPHHQIHYSTGGEKRKYYWPLKGYAFFKCSSPFLSWLGPLKTFLQELGCSLQLPREAF